MRKLISTFLVFAFFACGPLSGHDLALQHELEAYVASEEYRQWALSQYPPNDETKGNLVYDWEEIDPHLPTPNVYRTGSGAPGHEYWQQRVDYRIDVKLDDENQSITGSEIITYHNNSPDTLKYLWVMLDQNLLAADSIYRLSTTAPNAGNLSFYDMRRLLEREKDLGQEITAVLSADMKPLEHTIVDTMMRVDLPEPLKPGASFVFSIDWNHKLADATKIRVRNGFEYFEEDDNYVYTVAQWFPRLAAYSDLHGWHNEQYLSTEFALEFGNYEVHITVPEDHYVGATGVLQNPAEVMDETQVERLEAARDAEEPIFVVTPEEAAANEKHKAEGKETWIFKAENVRDYAWASSRKFIWDAQGTKVGDRPGKVMAMSLYTNASEPLWSKYSTHSIIHTLDVYSKYTFDYPYPTCWSINAPVGGMEYPMVTFQRARPEEDGTYSERTKYGLISVIIHEVGHNYFPMIVNSDERRWNWMDEGLNSFVQFLAETEWEEEYPSRPERSFDGLNNYMTGPDHQPIMTRSAALVTWGYNAYTKPTVGLNILRETILGRELFDYAFKEYAQRWMFKRPYPGDFFRTMEDASGHDLAWFWNTWFYSTLHVDLAIEDVKQYRVSTKNPEIEKARQREEREAEPEPVWRELSRDLPKRVDIYPSLEDFYDTYDDLEVTAQDREDYEKMLEDLEDWEKDLLSFDRYLHVISFANEGGVPMPLLLEFTYEDGSTEIQRIPVEVWRTGRPTVSKLFITEKKIATVAMDTRKETHDADYSDNHFPRRIELETIDMNKRENGRKNPMQRQREQEEREKKEAEAAEEEAEVPEDESGEDGGE